MRNSIYTFIFMCAFILSWNISNAQSISIELKERSSAANANFTEVDLHISDFDSMFSMQYAVVWDPEILEIESVGNFSSDIPDFSDASMSLPNQTNDPGILRLSWLSISTEPQSLPDDHRLFTMKFNYVGEECENTLLEVDDAPPVVIEFIDNHFNDIPLHSEAISVTIPGNNCQGTGGPLTCREEVTIDAKPFACVGEVTVEAIIGNHFYEHAQVVPASLTIDQLGVPVEAIVTVSNGGVSQTCKSTVTLVDNIPPVAIADDEIFVSLSFNGNEPPTAKLFAEQIDEGSFDACGDISFSPEFFEFDCSHIGEQTIVLTVIDESGNVNSVFTTVHVEYKLSAHPQLNCPDDAIVDCSLDIFDQEVIDNIIGGATVDFGCAPVYTTSYDYDENGDGDISDIFVFEGIEVSEKYNKSCSYGPVVRIWTVPGMNAGCQQIIVVKEADPFDGLTQIDWPYSKDAFVAVTSNDGAMACANTASNPGNGVDADDIILVPDSGTPEYAEINLLCEEDFCEAPAWDENTCNLLGYSVETKRFEFTDGVCLKIEKTYTVIDWCTYDPALSQHDGIWTWKVIAKIDDQQAPVVEAEDKLGSACTDVINVSATATDYTHDNTGTSVPFACPLGNIKWRVYLDINDDGTFDREWNSFVKEDANTPNDPLWSEDNADENIAEFGYTIPDVRVGNKGKVDNANSASTRSGFEYTLNIREHLDNAPGVAHRIEWRAEDGCGNVSTTTSYFSLDNSTDNVKPVPYCINISTATLQPATGSNVASVELYAIDFNIGSYDNCTAKENLRYTFSNVPPSQDTQFDASVNSSSKVFTMADFSSTASGIISINMYVWDESDNFDFCRISLRLYPPDDPCDIQNVKCSELTAVLDHNGTVDIWVQDLHVTFDNPCGVANTDLSFNPNHANLDKKTFNCAHLGSNEYTVYIFQNNHVTGSCVNTIHVLDLQNVCPNSGEHIELEFGHHYGLPGENVCIPMTVNKFKGVEAFQASINWDQTILEFTGTTNYNLPGMSAGSFGETNVSDGKLVFVWFDVTGTTPLSLPDGSACFDICFDVIGDFDDVSPLKITDDPIRTLAATSSSELPITIFNGNFTVGTDPCSSSQDTIKPTPYCHSSLTAYLTDPDGSGPESRQVEVLAIDFNAGSLDNCTAKHNLRFSFSDTNPVNDPDFNPIARSSSRIFTEADISGTNAAISLNVYVWDASDNHDFCTVSLKLKDVSEDPCLNNTEANILWPLDVIELSVSNVNLNALSAQFSPKNLISIYGYLQTEVEPTFINTTCVNGFAIAYDDVVILNGGSSFKIIRTFTVLDWYTGNVYTRHQIIKNVNAQELICDTLPNTAPVGDCESGHTLDDDVEWPADISIADHRIKPAELEAFSGIPSKDAKPVFYNANAAKYRANYVDLLSSLSTTELVIGRKWKVTRSDNANVSWSYEQKISVDITILPNLVTVNTINNRPIPNVQITDNVATDINGSAIVMTNDPLEPALTDEETNGLDLRDLVYMQNHILGQQFLGTLQVKAGDMNNDNMVSTFDLALVMGTMIGETNGYSDEWRFLDYTNNTSLGATPKGHYIGIKPGDVDDSALFGPGNPQMANSDLVITDQLLNAGESYIVPLTLNEAIATWGTHLNLEYNTDLIQVVNVFSDYFDGTMVWNEYAPGKISAISVSQTGTADVIDNTGTENILVYIEFKALQNGVIGKNLKLSDDRLSYMLLEDFTSRRFAGQLDGEITVNTIDLENKIYVSVFPNPASNYLNFEFTGPLNNERFALEILDVRGQRLMYLDDTNRVDVTSLSPGMYIYKIYVNDKIIADRFMVTR